MICETAMPFFSLHYVLIFARMLLSLGSFAQSGVAATPSLELSGNFTLPRLHNISNNGFPPRYIIPNTNPLIFLQIQPTMDDPLDFSDLTYLVVISLSSLVLDTIRSHGDNAIPEDGMLYVWHKTAVYAKSHLPGTVDLTYGITASLLRGTWEIVSLYGANALHMDVYVGRCDAAGYRGQISLYLYRTAVSKETA